MVCCKFSTCLILTRQLLFNWISIRPYLYIICTFQVIFITNKRWVISNTDYLQGTMMTSKKDLKMLLSIFHVRIDINLAYYVCIVNLLRMGFRQNLTFSWGRPNIFKSFDSLKEPFSALLTIILNIRFH